MNSALRISEAVSLGLHTMALISANPGRYYSTKEIAEKLSVSEAHLAKVLQRLARAGLLRSVRGPKGGFKLDKPRDEITLLQVFEVIDGPFVLTDCLMARTTCRGRGCIFGGLLKIINGKFREYLGEMTLVKLENIYR